ncbi:MAG TPA: hypothetical protein PLY00_18365, partial [Verrucomicrobiota bacterium]|nr:hypothetical protein [Verrucomicrobiota bacterium]HOG88880.1 hypothetical protein [Verrucomicrobiota bacterium]HOR73222.1 hypothetical protein [Verrucomicrobiota bacterium]HPV12564.1 hypothetical protein [Verrucomicrobiota bacterium]HPW82700.1 hypothetical protein [Verrucomicrobiota bacterium]
MSFTEFEGADRASSQQARFRNPSEILTLTEHNQTRFLRSFSLSVLRGFGLLNYPTTFTFKSRIVANS